MGSPRSCISVLSQFFCPAAAEFTDDFEEAWEALEMSRMVYEKFEELVGVASVRMSLGECAVQKEYSALLTHNVHVQVTRARMWSSGTTQSRSTGRRRACLVPTFPTGE